MLLCVRCRTHTKTIEPIYFQKLTFFCVQIRGLCEICLETKAKYLAPTELRRLPEEFKNIKLKQPFLKYVKVNDKCYELFPILGPIINE
jgi:hypothetical protein